MSLVIAVRSTRPRRSLKAFSVASRPQPESALKGGAHLFWVGEAAIKGDRLEGVVGCFQEIACLIQLDTFDEVVRRGAEFVYK